MSVTARRIVALVLASAVLGCSELTAPPAGAVELPHDAQFVAFWREVEKCSGLAGDHNAVRIYSVPADRTFQLKGESVAGYYDVARHAIFMSAAYITWRNGWRHEILHALLRAPGHPEQYFGGLCGPLVTPNR